jgi:histidinol-phosphate/aromatic aminotransferase/cobyric acid decarboxylase-like protein
VATKGARNDFDKEQRMTNTYSRITVGTKDDMDKFKAALMKVMA